MEAIAALADPLLRWVHISAALIWIGHNYVNVIMVPVYLRPRAPDLQDDAPDLARRSKREHASFRFASLVVWISGAIMLHRNGMMADALALKGAAAPIGLAAWIATIMVLNLWFIMWPHQKKVLGFVPASLEERIRCSRVTFLSSRSNTILSMPVLFLMVSGPHGMALF